MLAWSFKIMRDYWTRSSNFRQDPYLFHGRSYQIFAVNCARSYMDMHVWLYKTAIFVVNVLWENDYKSSKFTIKIFFCNNSGLVNTLLCAFSFDSLCFLLVLGLSKNFLYTIYTKTIINFVSSSLAADTAFFWITKIKWIIILSEVQILL